MNKQVRLSFADIYMANPAIAFDVALFDEKTAQLAAANPLGISLIRSCIALSDEMHRLIKYSNNKNEKETYFAACEMIDQLHKEHGIRGYHAQWAVTCWIKAAGSSVLPIYNDYEDQLDKEPIEKLRKLAETGDALAALRMMLEYPDDKAWLDMLEKYDYPGYYYYKGLDVWLDDDNDDPDRTTKALKLFQQGLDEGYFQGYKEIAIIYKGSDNFPADEDKFFYYSKEGAIRGNTECMVNLSDAYYNGMGVEKDVAKSNEYLLMAAENGNARIQRICGDLYLDGKHGFEEDADKALEWWDKAAKNGDEEAIFNMAEAHRLEDNKEWYDVAAAVEYYKIGAKRGYTDCMTVLGDIYLDGEGNVPMNRKEAFNWYKLAADLDNGYACYMVSAFYEGEMGIPKNLTLSKQYDLKSVELGYDPTANDDEDEEEDAPQNASQATGGTDLPSMEKMMEQCFTHIVMVIKKKGYSFNYDMCRGYINIILWILLTYYDQSVPDAFNKALDVYFTGDFEPIWKGYTPDQSADMFVEVKKNLDALMDQKGELSGVMDAELMRINSKYLSVQEIIRNNILEEQQESLRVFVKYMNRLARNNG